MDADELGVLNCIKFGFTVKLFVTFFLDKKSNQKNQAKNILPPHFLTHARIFGNPALLHWIFQLLNKSLSVCSRAWGGQKPRNEVRKCLNFKSKHIYEPNAGRAPERA